MDSWQGCLQWTRLLDGQLTRLFALDEAAAVDEAAAMENGCTGETRFFYLQMDFYL